MRIFLLELNTWIRSFQLSRNARWISSRLTILMEFNRRAGAGIALCGANLALAWEDGQHQHLDFRDPVLPGWALIWRRLMIVVCRLDLKSLRQASPRSVYCLANCWISPAKRS